MEITLKCGNVLVIDDADYPLIEPYKWRTRHISNPVEGKRVVAVDANINKRTIGIHRLLMNPPEDKVVDHRDGNPLNNRRENLRVCLPIQNLRNRKRRWDSKFLKGVEKGPRSRTYRVVIVVNRKKIAFGKFETEQEAHEAYCDMAKLCFGEFARFK